jgi:hypothetical protein
VTVALHPALAASPPPGPDQLYRIARQVRYDDKRAAVHRVTSSAFERRGGHTYRVACGEVLSAAGGAILTTRDVTCAGCTPGWKEGPT